MQIMKIENSHLKHAPVIYSNRISGGFYFFVWSDNRLQIVICGVY